MEVLLHYLIILCWTKWTTITSIIGDVGNPDK